MSVQRYEIISNYEAKLDKNTFFCLLLYIFITSLLLFSFFSLSLWCKCYKILNTHHIMLYTMT